MSTGARTLRLIQRIASERVRQKAVPRRNLARPAPTAGQTNRGSEVGIGSPPIVVGQVFLPTIDVPMSHGAPIWIDGGHYVPGQMDYSIQSARWVKDFPRPEGDEKINDTTIGATRIIREGTMELSMPPLALTGYEDNPYDPRNSEE